MEPLSKKFIDLLTAQLRPPQTGAVFTTRKLTDQKRLDYLHGEQFGAKGEYWMGRTTEDPKVLEEIARTFVCDNQIRTCIDRHVSAILGKDPEFDLLSGDTTLEGELVTEITDWWNAQRAHKTLKDLMMHVAGLGRSSLRVYVPSKFAAFRQQAPNTIRDALKLIRFHPLTPLQGGPVMDEFQDPLGYEFHYAIQQDNTTRNLIEIHTPEMIATYQLNGVTLGPIEIEPTENPIPGGFLLQQFERDAGPLITQTVIDLQNSLNEEWTYMRRDSQLGGFRTVWTTNASDPVDPDTKKPIPWDFSPANVMSIKGLPVKDEATGKVTFAEPNVGVLLPVDPSVIFIPKINRYQQAIEGKFNQTWVSDDFQDASGTSKQESRKAFDLMVTVDAGTAALAIKWLVETVLRFASDLSGQTLPENLTCKPKLYLAVNQGNLEEFTNLVDAYKQGLVSLETVLEVNPAVTDPVAEAERIRSGVNANTELALGFLQAGGSVAVAMEMLRNAGVTVITPEMIQRQQDAEGAPEPDPQDPNDPQGTTDTPA